MPPFSDDMHREALVLRVTSPRAAGIRLSAFLKHDHIGLQLDEWLAWGPILIGIFVGIAASEEPRPVAALRSGFLALGGVALAVGILALLALAGYVLYKIVTDYGILGVIAILLGVIVVMLGVLLARSRYLNG